MDADGSPGDEDGAVSRGAESGLAVSRGAVSRGAVSDGAVSRGAVSRGAVSDGAVADGHALTVEVARALVQVARPGVVLHRRASRADELVLAGSGEVFRLPLAPTAVARHAVLVRALPKLVPLLPVAVPTPRYVGVLEDGATPFTAERRLPGAPPAALDGIALGQLAGVVAALEAVPVREAQQWGVTGGAEDVVLLHGALGLDALLADRRSGLLTGVVGWDLRLGPAGSDREAALEADLAGLL